MQSTQVHRNLLDYEKKVGRSITLRTVCFTVAALTAGTAAGAACAGTLRLPWAATQAVLLAVTVPVWLAGFARPGGMKPEKWWPYGRRSLFGKTRILYLTSGRGPQGQPSPKAKKGGEWDVLAEAWEKEGMRRRGVESVNPDRI